MRRRPIAIMIVLILVSTSIGVFLTVPRLHVISYTNIAFSASGGFADLQIFHLPAGSEFSIVLQADPVNAHSGLLSIQSPDGSFLVKNANLTYLQIFTYDFVAGKSGAYSFNFTAPLLGSSFNSAGNITIHESLIGQFYELDPINQQVKLPSNS